LDQQTERQLNALQKEDTMPDKRTNNRNSCFLRGDLVLANGKDRIPCTVHDISETGAKVKPETDVTVPDFVTLDVPRRGLNEPVRVIRRGESEVGVLFINTKEK
jgi:PilZ domain